MGERPEGRARTGSGDEFTREGVDGRRDDIDRIAGAARKTAGARAALVSRVLDAEWLQFVSVAAGSGDDLDDLAGSRWRRADLERCLASAERRGSLHATQRRALAHVEVPRVTRPASPA